MSENDLTNPSDIDELETLLRLTFLAGYQAGKSGEEINIDDSPFMETLCRVIHESKDQPQSKQPIKRKTNNKYRIGCIKRRRNE